MTLRLQARCAVCGVPMQARLDVPAWPKALRLNCPRQHTREYKQEEINLEYRREDQRMEQRA